jgi:predicted metal-dependent phosphoesterase TrpH
MVLKIDLHVHTIYSGDSVTTPTEALLEAKRKKLDGIAITDHNNVNAYRMIPKDSEVLVIPGIEVSSKEGHILGLGVTEPIQLGLPAVDTVIKIHQLGGVAVISHPMAPLKSSLNESDVIRVEADALETLNGSTLSFTSKKGMKLASRLKLPQTGGSDSHHPDSIGRAYTMIEAELDVNNILEAIRMGNVKPMGSNASLGFIITKMGRKIKKKVF